MGHEVLGIDASPLAIKTARARGLRKAKVLPIERVTKRLGVFGTVLMLGNNFGLFGSPTKARRLLRRFLRITSPDACIIAESYDIYQTKDQNHRDYQRRNRRRGRMSGQIRIRMRYLHYRTPYADYLMVSLKEMKSIIKNSGWRISAMFSSGGPAYIVVLTRP